MHKHYTNKIFVQLTQCLSLETPVIFCYKIEDLSDIVPVSVSAPILASAVNSTIIVHVFVVEYLISGETVNLTFDRVFTTNQFQQHQIGQLKKFSQRLSREY